MLIKRKNTSYYRNTHRSLVVSVSQLSVPSIPPGEHLPVRSEGHGVPASRTHRHLAHYVGAQLHQWLGGADVSKASDPQTAVGTLATAVYLEGRSELRPSLGTGFGAWDWNEVWVSDLSILGDDE